MHVVPRLKHGVSSSSHPTTTLQLQFATGPNMHMVSVVVRRTRQRNPGQRTCTITSGTGNIPILNSRLDIGSHPTYCPLEFRPLPETRRYQGRKQCFHTLNRRVTTAQVIICVDSLRSLHRPILRAYGLSSSHSTPNRLFGCFTWSMCA